MNTFRVTALGFVLLVSRFSPAAVAESGQLISLVPPGAVLVADLESARTAERPQLLLLADANNTRDLDDMRALTGAASDTSIHRVIFVSDVQAANRTAEHSLLASGSFNREHIYKSMISGGGRFEEYRAVPIVELGPFARERATLHELRWLVILNSDTLLFGSPGSVRVEIDRFIDKSPVDPPLLKRLLRLRDGQQTWSVVTASYQSTRLKAALRMLDPTLADLICTSGAFGIAFRYAKKVELEYDVDASSGGRSDADKQPGLALSPSRFRSAAEGGKMGNSTHGVVKISRRHYEAWLSAVK